MYYKSWFGVYKSKLSEEQGECEVFYLKATNNKSNKNTPSKGTTNSTAAIKVYTSTNNTVCVSKKQN